jgi:hypothetical protein
MHEYGKTENIFTRDEETHKLVPWDYRQEEVRLIDQHSWLFTEKIDGTNVRLTFMPAQDELDYEMYGTFSVALRGRSDNATLPEDLEVPAFAREPEDEPGAIFETYRQLGLADELGPRADIAVTLYGEAYGAGIQKGGGYSPDKRIRYFDLVTTPIIDGVQAGRHSFRPFTQLQAVADTLSLPLVPVLAFDHLTKAVEGVRAGFPSLVAIQEGGLGREAEGVVGRTDPYLYDFRGSRVFFKIKTKDFA